MICAGWVGSMVRNQPVDVGQTLHGHIDTFTNKWTFGSIRPHLSDTVLLKDACCVGDIDGIIRESWSVCRVYVWCLPRERTALMLHSHQTQQELLSRPKRAIQPAGSLVFICFDRANRLSNRNKHNLHLFTSQRKEVWLKQLQLLQQTCCGNVRRMVNALYL